MQGRAFQSRKTRRAYGLICELYMSDIYKILFTHCPFPRIIGDADEVEEWKSMQYTELTRKELQREYTRLTQRYSSYMREPMELDMRAEGMLPLQVTEPSVGLRIPEMTFKIVLLPAPTV